MLTIAFYICGFSSGSPGTFNLLLHHLSLNECCTRYQCLLHVETSVRTTFRRCLRHLFSTVGYGPTDDKSAIGGFLYRGLSAVVTGTRAQRRMAGKEVAVNEVSRQLLVDSPHGHSLTLSSLLVIHGKRAALGNNF